jgi:hypothetical protein
LEKDDLRDKAEGRDAVFAVLKKSLENHKPFITLSGDKNLRLEKQSQLSMICQRLKNWVIVARFCPYNYGIPFENVCGQLNTFKRDFKMMLVEPAKVFKGILKLSEKF